MYDFSSDFSCLLLLLIAFIWLFIFIGVGYYNMREAYNFGWIKKYEKVVRIDVCFLASCKISSSVTFNCQKLSWMETLEGIERGSTFTPTISPYLDFNSAAAEGKVNKQEL